PGVLRAVAIALVAQGAFRLLFLAYTILPVAAVVSGTFWSDNPKFVAESAASFVLGIAAIVVGAGILRDRPWARSAGITICAIALLGEAYAGLNIANNFAQLGVRSTALLAGLTAIYSSVFAVSLIVLSQWRSKPADTRR